MPTAVIYARVSTARQAEEELPIESQVEQCRRKAEELGARVVMVFRDEGKSGRDERRAGFRGAIEYCEIQGVDYFITWSSSRFARDKVHAGMAKRLLKRAGTRLVYVSSQVDPDTDDGWILDSIFEFTDELYSRTVAKDTLRSMLKNAREGYWNGGAVPYGYRAEPAPENPRRKRLVPEEMEAAVVRRIFAEKLEGNGAKAIATLLNAAGHTNRGKRWTKSAISPLLRNPTVRGYVVFGRRHRESGTQVLRPRDQWTVVQSHPAIIEEPTWDAVQALLDREEPTQPDTGSPNSQHLFTGVLRCGRCGASLQIETAKGRTRRYSYYNCRNAQRHGTCANRRLPADDLDAWLVQVIADEVLTEENLAGVVEEIEKSAGRWAREREQRRRAVAQSLQAVQRANERLYSVLELHGKDAPNLGDLTRRLRANNQEIKRLEEELGAIDGEQPPAVLVTRDEIALLRAMILEVITETKNPKKARAFFGSFISAIVVEQDHIRIEYKPSVLVNRPAVHSTASWLPGTDVLGTRTHRAAVPAAFLRRA